MMRMDDDSIELYLKDLYKRCIDKWGSLSQLLMVVEELNELSVAILHLIRANKESDTTEVIKEYIDAFIMMDQLRFMLEVDESILETLRDKKIEYIETLLLEDST